MVLFEAKSSTRALRKEDERITYGSENATKCLPDQVKNPEFKLA